MYSCLIVAFGGISRLLSFFLVYQLAEVTIFFADTSTFGGYVARVSHMALDFKQMN
jgi:hypothetical protein